MGTAVSEHYLRDPEGQRPVMIGEFVPLGGSEEAGLRLAWASYLLGRAMREEWARVRAEWPETVRKLRRAFHA